MRRSLSIAAVLLGWAVASAADDAGPAPDELFKKLDVNGDGKLTASEIPKEHRKFFERLLRIGDENKDGELSRDEFDRALRPKDESVTDINTVGGLIGGGGGPGGQGINPKRLFATLDKNKDGKLTRDEVGERPRIKALFDRLGKDELTVDDLAAIGKGSGKPGGNKGKKAKARTKVSAPAGEQAEGMERPSDHRGSPLFRLLDTDQDGRLSREEFSKAAELFDKLDRNGDGYLDAKELLGAAPSATSDEMDSPSIVPGKKRSFGGGGGGGRRGNLSVEQQAQRLIMNADKDGDGKLSPEEAPARWKAHFSKIDTNGDGFLDRQEIEAALQKMHRRQQGNSPEPNSNSPDSPAPNPFRQVPAF